MCDVYQHEEPGLVSSGSGLMLEDGAGNADTLNCSQSSSVGGERPIRDHGGEPVGQGSWPWA